MIYSFHFTLRVKDEVIVQPFSSKVSRIAVSNISPSYLKITDTPGVKPFRVTVIKDSRKPLFSTGKELLKLVPGKDYSFTLTSLSDEVFREVVNTSSARFKLYTTEAEVELRDVKIVNQQDLILEDSDTYYVKFLTPTLLQPPRPSFKRKKNRYVLFPYPPLILNSLVTHWNAFSDFKITGVGGLKALYYFREVSYNITPVTVPYDKGKVRGFIGWVKFALDARRGSKLRENIRRLLAYGNYFGVGKSRSIGFGEIRVFTKARKDDK